MKLCVLCQHKSFECPGFVAGPGGFAGPHRPRKLQTFDCKPQPVLCGIRVTLMRYLQQQLLLKPIHVRSKLDSEQLPAVQVVSWTLACSTCLSLHAFFC